MKKVLMGSLFACYSLSSFAYTTVCSLEKNGKQIEVCYLGDMKVINNGDSYGNATVSTCSLSSKKKIMFLLILK
jgi:enoyl-[acyl-carrier-protein] reductase (NADH)